jgi:hypothetical protein
VTAYLRTHSTLGATDPFFDAASTTHHYPFHEISEEAYMEASAAQGSPASATAVTQAMKLPELSL